MTSGRPVTLQVQSVKPVVCAHRLSGRQDEQLCFKEPGRSRCRVPATTHMPCCSGNQAQAVWQDNISASFRLQARERVSDAQPAASNQLAATADEPVSRLAEPVDQQAMQPVEPPQTGIFAKSRDQAGKDGLLQHINLKHCTAAANHILH